MEDTSRLRSALVRKTWSLPVVRLLETTLMPLVVTLNMTLLVSRMVTLIKVTLIKVTLIKTLMVVLVMLSMPL